MIVRFYINIKENTQAAQELMPHPPLEYELLFVDEEKPVCNSEVYSVEQALRFAENGLRLKGQPDDVVRITFTFGDLSSVRDTTTIGLHSSAARGIIANDVMITALVDCTKKTKWLFRYLCQYHKRAAAIDACVPEELCSMAHEAHAARPNEEPENVADVDFKEGR